MSHYIEANGKQLSLAKARVMAIINLTPDSFYDGGKFSGISDILKDAEQKIKDGATIIDIGAVSTRPGAENISNTEEFKRLLEPLKALRKSFPEVFISVDTFRSEIAQACIEEGADIINDVSGGMIDLEIFNVVTKANIPYVLMHMKGTPQTMQKSPEYEDILKEIGTFFKQQINILKEKGHAKIILDPGYGFGKTKEHNYHLLKYQNHFLNFGFPILAGVSRKSMINQLIHTSPVTSLNGTTVVNTIALLNGAKILRVHDVKEAIQAIEITHFYQTIK